MGKNFSKGTGAQFEAALEAKIAQLGGDVVGGVESATTIESARHASQIKVLQDLLLNHIGSRANAADALAIDLGDGSFAWAYEDNDGEVNLVGAGGNPLAAGYEDIVAYVKQSWGIESCTNTSNVTVMPDTVDDIYSDSEIGDESYFEQLAEALDAHLDSYGFEIDYNAHKIILTGPSDDQFYQFEDSELNMSDVDADADYILNTVLKGYNR